MKRLAAALVVLGLLAVHTEPIAAAVAIPRPPAPTWKRPEAAGILLFQDTSVLATNRKIAWSSAGSPTLAGYVANGDTRTRCGSVISSYTGNANAINSAIAGCGTNQYVELGAGTFTLSSSIDFAGKSNVTLRGQGPSSTFIVFTGNSFGCGGLFADICIWPGGGADDIDSPQNTASWTAGYSKGTTQITLSSVANLQVGAIIHLDQLDDSNTDNGTLWNCETAISNSTTGCAGEGGRSGRNSPGTRNQTESPTVTAIDTTNKIVTISPGLKAPNWRSGQTPGAWWRSGTPVHGDGVENLSVDAANNGLDTVCGGNCGGRGIFVFSSSTDSWVRNVIGIKGKRAMVLFYLSNHNTVRDSYFHTSRSLADQAYGVEIFASDDNLIENNIIQDIVAGVIPQGFGNVAGYNYGRDHTYNPTGATFPPGNGQIQAGDYHHDGGTMYTLYEGNDDNSFKADGIHGTNNFGTGFRNYYSGTEPLKDCHTVGVMVYSFNRFYNIIGNVLGTSGYHTSYNADQTGCSGKQIYALDVQICNPFNSICRTDSGKVASTMMRWGNYDVVTGTNFTSGEVPSGLSDYPNSVPGSTTLSASFYRASRPGFFTTTWGTVAWPAMGPDITGAALQNGHANKIPARLCYENLSHTTTGATYNTIQLISNFDANSCYSATGGGGDTTPPTVTVTSPASTPFSFSGSSLSISGTAADDTGVADCTWTNSAGGSGSCTGLTSWSFTATIAPGTNIITITVHDLAGNPSTPAVQEVDRPLPTVNRIRKR
jgi:hypothetical protein